MEENCTRPNPAPHPGAPHPRRTSPAASALAPEYSGARVFVTYYTYIRMVIRFMYSFHAGHRNRAKRPSHMELLYSIPTQKASKFSQFARNFVTFWSKINYIYNCNFTAIKTPG